MTAPASNDVDTLACGCQMVYHEKGVTAIPVCRTALTLEEDWGRTPPLSPAWLRREAVYFGHFPQRPIER